MYEMAEANAKSTGESSRARRFDRGIKTLKDLIKQANMGKVINDDDIPPEVSVGGKKVEAPSEPLPPSVAIPSRPAPIPPSRPAPIPPSVMESKSSLPDKSNEASPKDERRTALSDTNKELLLVLNTRRDEYKISALRAKKEGNTEVALKFVKILKQFEAVIEAVESGQTVDLTNMPGPPPPVQPKIEDESTQNSENIEQNPSEVPDDSLIKAGSLIEDLQQRLDLYKKQEETATEQGNSSKARRMGRIVKQFEQAVKLHKAGKPVPLDELPTPPGYAPLGVEGGGNKVEEIPSPQPVVSKPQPSPDEDSSKNRSPKVISPPPRSAVSRISGKLFLNQLYCLFYNFK